MTVESPCIGLCRLNDKKVCIGCHRTDKEIQGWLYADDEEKLKILESVEKRKKQENTMSSENEKVKVSRRRANEDNVIRKQVKIAKAHGLTDKDKQIKEPHRYAKHHAMDCGNPGCMLCSNPRHNKLFKTKDKLTTQERRFFQDVDHPKYRHGNGKPYDPDETD